MAFWGIEIRAGKPFTLSPDKSCGRLRISQATLGMGSSDIRSMVQCNVGKKTPVMLCCLLPDKAESCPLDLEFEEAEEVTFSVVGPRSVYLTGYFLGNARRSVAGDDETESYGEDIGAADTENSDNFSDENEYEEDSFIDDSDPEVFAPSPSTSDEITKTKADSRKCSRKRLKKKYELSESEDDGGFFQQKTTSDSKCEPIVERVQEDQIPISSLCGSAKADDKKRKGHDNSGNATDDHQSEDKKVKKKKKKRKNNEENGAVVETVNDLTVAKNEVDHSLMETGGIINSTRTISGGLIVEEIHVGEEDAKVASSGKKVTIHYTGRLREGGQIFDSSTGKDPLKFRLGKGRVMDGLDLGIEGMRVGGKRKLQIPPALGYGSEGSGCVPPNSWLIMDVELLQVR